MEQFVDDHWCFRLRIVPDGWLEDLIDMRISQYVRNQQVRQVSEWLFSLWTMCQASEMDCWWVPSWHVNISINKKSAAFRLGKSSSDYLRWFKHQRLIPECEGACDRLQPLFVKYTLYHLADSFYEIHLAQTNGLLCCWIEESFLIEASKPGILPVKANRRTK